MMPGGVAVARRPFSWGKAVLHALAPVVLMAAAGLVAAIAELVPSAAAAGELVGGAAFFLFPAGFAASWLFQTGRRGCGAALAIPIALGVLAVGGGLLAFPWVMRLAAGGLTAAERDFPEIYWAAGGQRYRHPAFGFSLPAPSGRFQEAPALAEQLRAGLAAIGAWAWAWEDASTGERIMLTLVKGPGSEQEDFEDYCRGMTSAVAGEEGVAVRNDEVRWNDGRGDYLLRTVIRGQVHYDTRCISGPVDGGDSYVACVMTVAGDPEWPRRLLAGFEGREGTPPAGGEPG